MEESVKNGKLNGVKWNFEYYFSVYYLLEVIGEL